jgi:hypothetical protein
MLTLVERLRERRWYIEDRFLAPSGNGLFVVEDDAILLREAEDRIAALEEALRRFPGGLITDGPQPPTGFPTRYLMVRADDYKLWRDGVDALIAAERCANPASAHEEKGT